MAAQSQWWLEKEAKVAEAVHVLVKMIRENSVTHTQDLLKAFRLYGNFESRGLAAGDYFRPNVGRNNRYTLNIIKSCVDTLCSRLGKSVPKATFLTSGGTWSQQKKAKLLDKFDAGIRYQTGFPATARKILRDGAVFGKGGVKIAENERGRIQIDRVFPDEFVVDDMEAASGLPRQMHQTRVLSRPVLLKMFADDPAAEKLIQKAKPNMMGSPSQRQVESADLLTVFESWHLPSEPLDGDREGSEYVAIRDKESLDHYKARLMDGHDGRHAFSLENGTLLFEAWRADNFPFEFFDWLAEGPLRGFWVTGLPIDLLGIQYEANKLCRRIQECADFCVPKLLVENSSKVVLGHLDDLVMGILKYSVNKPELIAWNTIPPQLLEQLANLIRQAYEISGISQLSAQSKKPAGLDSGAALREYDDIQSERFANLQVSFEDFCVRVSKQTIRLARRIADRDGDYSTAAPQRKRTMVKIAWKEIDLADDDFIMEVFPSSSLPRTPAGRLAMVTDLMNLGFLDKEDVLRLLDFPDLEAVNALNEASAEFTNKQLEDMIEHGKAAAPQPFQNLAYALKHAQSAYLLASTMDVEEPRLQLVRNYMQQVTALMAASQPRQPAPPPGAQPGIPAGPPTMPGPGMPVAGPGAPPPPSPQPLPVAA